MIVSVISVVSPLRPNPTTLLTGSQRGLFSGDTGIAFIEWTMMSKWTRRSAVLSVTLLLLRPPPKQSCDENCAAPLTGRRSGRWDAKKKNWKWAHNPGWPSSIWYLRSDCELGQPLMLNLAQLKVWVIKPLAQIFNLLLFQRNNETWKAGHT